MQKLVLWEEPRLGSRVVFLTTLCRCVLGHIHDNHCRVEDTWSQALHVVYWLGFDVDNVDTVRS